MSRLHTTPRATVGPYLAIGLTWDDGAHAVAPGTAGAIWLGLPERTRPAAKRATSNRARRKKDKRPARR